MRSYIRLIGLALTLVACLAVGTGQATGTVERSVDGAKATRTVTFSTTLTKPADVKSRFAVQEIIACSGFITFPAQVGGAVRVDIHAECSAPVDNIRLVPAILINGVVMAERPENFPGVAAADRFAVFGCPGVPLTYVGRGTATFTKAGFVNSPFVLSGDTLPVSIFC
jgi:hypothetical protein